MLNDISIAERPSLSYRRRKEGRVVGKYSHNLEGFKLIQLPHRRLSRENLAPGWASCVILTYRKVGNLAIISKQDKKTTINCWNSKIVKNNSF